MDTTTTNQDLLDALADVRSTLDLWSSYITDEHWSQYDAAYDELTQLMLDLGWVDPVE